ncbi:glycosyltransferase family 4 protein [Alteromonas sp. 14N.309.X.WAT.G.H12]|uniref:glycosyltransferase family 4 protein n=1 Tax=Alteromonas sp. 14N.309.X.WAT.G.H12 TaxID=3120824 RepID=UPI002FD02A53
MNKPLLVIANLYPTEERPFFGTFVKNTSIDLESKGIQVDRIVLPQFGKGFLAYLKFYLSCFLKLTSFEGIVYVHYVSHSILGVLAARIVNKKFKVVLHYHGSDAFPESYEGSFRRRIKRAICKKSNKLASLFVVPSNYFRRKISSSYRIPKSMIIISPSGGIDLDVFYPSKGNVKMSSNELTYLFASRFVPGKGSMQAAQTAVEVAKENPNVNFRFVGDGPEKPEIEKLLSNLVAQGRCEIKPSLPQNQLADEFRKADFFMFPSVREGESLGLVVIEAMACGAIPLAIRQGAIDEIIGECPIVTCDEQQNFSSLVASTAGFSKETITELRNRFIDRSLNYNREIVVEHLVDEFNKL